MAVLWSKGRPQGMPRVLGKSSYDLAQYGCGSKLNDRRGKPQVLVPMFPLTRASHFGIPVFRATPIHPGFTASRVKNLCLVSVSYFPVPGPLLCPNPHVLSSARWWMNCFDSLRYISRTLLAPGIPCVWKDQYGGGSGIPPGTVAPRNSGGPCLERHPEASGYAGQRDAGFLRPRIHPLTWVGLGLNGAPFGTGLQA